MNKYAYREQILIDALRNTLKLTTQDAAKILKISDSSARRFFTQLENDGKILRVYGGVKLASNNISLSNYSFEELRKTRTQEKISIATMASSFIEDNDILYFDCGTTLFQLSLIVADAISSGSLNNLKIITNSLANLEVLHPHCEVILVGGNYNSNRKDFSGYSAEIYIKQFNYKKAFLGSDGFDEVEGFMASSENISKLNEVAISRTEKSYVLLDSSKFGKKAFVSFSSPNKITAAITDSLLTGEQEELYNQLGLTIIKSTVLKESW